LSAGHRDQKKSYAVVHHGKEKGLLAAPGKGEKKRRDSRVSFKFLVHSVRCPHNPCGGGEKEGVKILLSNSAQTPHLMGGGKGKKEKDPPGKNRTMERRAKRKEPSAENRRKGRDSAEARFLGFTRRLHSVITIPETEGNRGRKEELMWKRNLLA